jgi:hypothetical protein
VSDIALGDGEKGDDARDPEGGEIEEHPSRLVLHWEQKQPNDE